MIASRFRFKTNTLLNRIDIRGIIPINPADTTLLIYESLQFIELAKECNGYVIPIGDNYDKPPKGTSSIDFTLVFPSLDEINKFLSKIQK